MLKNNASLVLPPRTLPPELIDIILRQVAPKLDDDFPSRVWWPDSINTNPHPNHDIASCALVCRDWCVIARPYLFRTLSCSFRAAFEELDERIEVYVDVMPQSYRDQKTLDELVEFLRNHPHLARYVTQLILHMNPAFEIYDDWTVRFPHPSLLIDVVNALPRKTLRTIELDGVILDRAAFRTHSWFGCLGSIDTVAVTYDSELRFDGLSPLSNLLLMFKFINTLKLAHMNVAQDNDDPFLFHGTQITTLQIFEVFSMVPLAPRTADAVVLRSIENLVIKNPAMPGFEDVESLNEALSVRGMGETLKHLELGIDPFDDSASSHLRL